MDNTEEQKEPKYNIEGPIVLDKIDLSQFNMSASDSSPKRKRRHTKKNIRMRRGIDMDICVKALTWGKNAICNDKEWCDMVNALPSAATVTIADNAKILPKEFYIGMALMLDYETCESTNMTTDDELFVTMAGSVANAMVDDDGYVGDEYSLKYAKPILDALCNVYNSIQAMSHKSDVEDIDENILRRRIISPVLKNVCVQKGYIFGDWERIITMPVVELAAKVAIQMGSSAPYIVVYEKMMTITTLNPYSTDKELSGTLGNVASGVESEVMAILLFFMLLTKGDNKRKAVKINMKPETIAAMTDLETNCEVALEFLRKTIGASTRGIGDIDELLTHLKRQYVMEHPSGVLESAEIITETVERIRKENASIQLTAYRTPPIKYPTKDTGSLPSESNNSGNKPKISIPAELFTYDIGDADEYIPRIAYTDAVKIDRLLSFLCDNHYIDNDNRTRITFVYRMTGIKIDANFEPLEKIKWGRDKKPGSILYMCKVLFTHQEAAQVERHTYDKAKKFFDADTDGNIPFSEMGSSYASHNHADKDLVAELKKIFTDN